jgi:tetratricopeptide (TPR) repeat protein
MMRHLTSLTALTAMVFTCAFGTALHAQPAAPGTGGPATKPALINWSAKDTTGKTIVVPAADRLSVLVFAMAGQDRSASALKQARQVIGAADIQALAVVSGENAAVEAQKLAAADTWSAPVVADPAYDASGRMAVRVWPTTVLVDAKGRQVAHLAGLASSYAKDLEAYLDFARGKIDQAELDKRLSGHDLVASTAQTTAERHLQVATRLLDKGELREAGDEVARGLKILPNDTLLLLFKARVHLLLNEPAETLKTLDTVDAKAVAPWQIGGLRGRALAALGKWDEARQALTGALQLNPDPAEVYYGLGLVYQHDGKWKEAADAFRQAFESSASARKTVAPPADKP